MRIQRLNNRRNPVLNILLVGQSQTILQAMKDWLAPLGHRLTWVVNGLEAIRELRQQQFDLVVTELAMPGLDGPLIAQFLRNTNDHATIVGLSSDWYHDRSCDLKTDNSAESDLFDEAVAAAG